MEDLCHGEKGFFFLLLENYYLRFVGEGIKERNVARGVFGWREKLGEN